MQTTKIALAALALQAAMPLAAQAPVLPTIPAPTQSDLNRNLTRLAENPRDIEALIGAGEAALRLKDARAATGFFARADDIDPANGRVKAGLARSMLGVQQPAEALRLFQEAERLGGGYAPIAGDRGFAYDLLGDPGRAQAEYALAYRADPNDPELIRRYAVSLGISGKVQDANRMLDPLLRKSDREAWRNRAFIYAINGDVAEARKITEQTLPPDLARAVDPYLQRMTLLTPGQQVAAVHLGQFPGNVMAMAPLPAGTRPPVQIASAAPPRQAPPPPSRPAAEPQTVRPPAVAARPESRSMLDVERRRPGGVAPAVTFPSQPSPGFQSMAPTPARPPAIENRTVAPPVTTPPVEPARPAAQVRTAQAMTAPPARATVPVDRTLADIFAGIEVPPEERAVRIAAVSLDEVAALQAARRKQEAEAAAKAKADATAKGKAKAEAEAKAKAKEEAEAKAKAKANPARIWVQIATGRDTDALAYDMRKRRKAQGDTFAGKTAWTADFGATNRLVIGPFASAEKAKAWLSDWRKSGGEGGYVWNSEQGAEVTKLAEK